MLLLIIKILIWIHVVTGTTAMLAGGVAMSTKKGSKFHLQSGAIFFWTLLVSVVLSLIIAALPGHENTFLFTIGIFTLYLLLGGYSAIRYQQKGVNLMWDKLLSYLMLLTGVSMITYPILVFGGVNIVLASFGSVGIVLSVIDLKRFRNPEKLREKYVQIHLTKIIGAFIASITAFIVANGVVSGLMGWLSPGVIGSFVIFYWLRKLKKKRKVA